MPLLPSTLLDRLSAERGLWPGNLLDEQLAQVREVLEAVLGDLPEEVASEISGALGEPEKNLWARTVLAAVDAARRAESRPVGMAAPGCLLMQDAQGGRWALGALGFVVDEFPGGRPGDVVRLTEALDQTFSERRYVLYLRRAVPQGFDPAPIARAVHLWLGAIDRGEWQGQHAIYEDQDVALELILTGDRGRASSNRVFTVGPITALERLAGVDSQLVRQTMGFQEAMGDLPVICALGADQPWRMPRGYVEQLLYGTANFVCAEGPGEERSYEAGFSPNGRSLFSDPACRNLMGLWWVEPEGPDPLAYRLWAHDNPWSPQLEHAPAVPAPRFALARRDDVGARERRSVVLSWRGGGGSWRVAR